MHETMCSFLSSVTAGAVTLLFMDIASDVPRHGNRVASEYFQNVFADKFTQSGTFAVVNQ